MRGKKHSPCDFDKYLLNYKQLIITYPVLHLTVAYLLNNILFKYLCDDSGCLVKYGM